MYTIKKNYIFSKFYNKNIEYLALILHIMKLVMIGNNIVQQK